MASVIVTLFLCGRALFTCCQLGLWGTAHTDGNIVLRLLPTGARNERQTVRVEPDAPLLALNVPEFRAPFLVRAHPVLAPPSSPIKRKSCGAHPCHAEGYGAP